MDDISLDMTGDRSSDGLSAAPTPTLAPVEPTPAEALAAQSHDEIATPAGDAGEPSVIPQTELDLMTEQLIERLKTVYDPEIPVDIYELGLIYRVDISDDRDVVVDMTLTAPGCPVAGDMPGWVQDAVEGVQGVRACSVNLTFDPPWDPSRMSDEAKLQLNMF